MSQSKLTTFLSNSNIETNYKKIITVQSKAFEFKAKELTKISPPNLIHLQEYVVSKLKEEVDHTEWL